MSNDFKQKYIKMVSYIMSKSFRVPMKQFIDKHCSKFENKQESEPFQLKLHDEFKQLVETLLLVALEDSGISEKEFSEISKVGLEKEDHKPYFEQIISCDNFVWFKNNMIKRNLQLKEESVKLMYVNNGDLKYTQDSTINKMLKDKEQAEFECALAMSLAADDDKKKLYSNKDEDELAVS